MNSRSYYNHKKRKLDDYDYDFWSPLEITALCAVLLRICIDVCCDDDLSGSAGASRYTRNNWLRIKSYLI